MKKTQLYTFEFPDREKEWCYSAKEFNKNLQNLCVGKQIKRIFVSETNYTGPLRVQENYVDYYDGPELIIQLDDVLIDLDIYSHGLFKWRKFYSDEYIIKKLTSKIVGDIDNHFCDIGNVYGMFKVEYLDVEIKSVVVEEFGFCPSKPDTFDETMLGTPPELPGAVCFQLANGYTLYLEGFQDEFFIKLFPISHS